MDSPCIVRYNAAMHDRLQPFRTSLFSKRPGTSLVLWFGLLMVGFLLAACGSSSVRGSTPYKASSATPCTASVRVLSTPPGATIYLDDEARGFTPSMLKLEPKAYRLRLESEGYETVTIPLVPHCDHETVISESLRDNTPPRMQLDPLPASVGRSEGLKIVAAATDNVGVVHMALFVDGRLVYEVDESCAVYSLRHNLNTLAMTFGKHSLAVEARDAEGNLGRQTARFEVLAPTLEPVPSATATVRPQVREMPAVRASLAPTEPPKQAPTPPGHEPISVRWGEITVDTYDYQRALYTDPDKAGHPYSLLHRDRVGPPKPQIYRVLFLRNEYLELTLMPDLGGRIYQCRFIPTGQTLFYNNRAIKPTHWGPTDQGWWLAVGGMEFCLPVDEHGYLTAEPWTLDVVRHEDGGATATMRIVERTRNIEARIGITLHSGESSFQIHSNLRNLDAEPKAYQYWINAMLSPGSHGIGPSLRFYYPATEVIVHSRGDPSLPGAGEPMSWPIYNGRDMSRYANWRNWLGFFATDLSEPFTAVYDEAAQLGMVRAFPAEIARGAKLFGFGRGFGDTGAYTDDGSQYIEMWGGLTPTFWDDAQLGPLAETSWEETWYVISRCDGVSTATADAALWATRDLDQLDLCVASPGEYHWLLEVIRNGEQVASQEFSVQPDAPFRTRIDLRSGNPDDRVVVRIMDGANVLVLSYIL